MSRVRENRMHGLTGGGWKRSDLAKVTGVAQPTGKPAAHEGPRPYRQARHRASPRPYTGVDGCRWRAGWPVSGLDFRLGV